jgi:hypothetical protein
MEKMGVEYDRIQRKSIYHPATIGDIPFEVIQNSFLPLGPASLSCRAWRQTAVEVILAKKGFEDEREMGRFICGMQLKTIVSGFEQNSIKKLELDMIQVGADHVRMIAPFVASTLSTLHLKFKNPRLEEDGESDFDYKVLELFFSLCPWIRNLGLNCFDFGNDPSSLTPTIKDGFSRLKSFQINDCYGDLRMFVEQAPIQNLSYLTHGGGFWDVADPSEIISAIAMKSRSLRSVCTSADLDSWDFIHSLSKYCRELEKIVIWDGNNSTSISEVEFAAIASLPRLNSLEVYCWYDDGSISPLARCKGLKVLGGIHIDSLSESLPAIGRNLSSLSCCGMDGLEGLSAIVKYCPNLEYLDVMIGEVWVSKLVRIVRLWSSRSRAG